MSCQYCGYASGLRGGNNNTCYRTIPHQPIPEERTCGQFRLEEPHAVIALHSRMMAMYDERDYEREKRLALEKKYKVMVKKYRAKIGG